MYSKKDIVEYTYVDQNHHYIVKCTNRNNNCNRKINTENVLM